jgi:H+/gluconate symporter-like permease
VLTLSGLVLLASVGWLQLFQATGTGSTMASHDGDESFIKVLNIMGIDEFDALVPTALNEYAASKRFAIPKA